MSYNTSNGMISDMDEVNLSRNNWTGLTTANSTGRSYKFSASALQMYFLVGLILNILWTVLIIILNIAVIVIISKYKKRTRLYFFLFHLALADLLTGLIHCVPHSVERAIGYEDREGVWLAGDLFCKLQWTLGHVSVMTSNYILAVMSVDRAFAVCRPMKSIHMNGYFVQKVGVICCWLFSLLVCSPYFKFIRTHPNYKSKRPACISNYSENYYYEVELILKFSFLFLIPFTIIIISYVILLFAVHKRPSKTIQGGESSESLAHVFNCAIPKSKIKSIKLTIGIVLSFILCWTAYFTGEFLGTFARIGHPIYYVMTTFYYLNGVANPVLFFIYHQRKPSYSRSSSSYNYSLRKVENSGNVHLSLGSRLSDMKSF